MQGKITCDHNTASSIEFLDTEGNPDEQKSGFRKGICGGSADMGV
jgi:hypothetical protein